LFSSSFLPVALAAVAGIIIARAPASAAAPTCTSMVGSWKNQLGSTLTIKSINSTTGAVAGSYKSPSGTSGKTYPLVGWVNSAKPAPKADNVSVISLTVRWSDYGSITAWTGTCSAVNGTPTITTLWHLVSANSSFTWDHVLTNSDTFTPLATP
jgi:Avidin family